MNNGPCKVPDQDTEGRFCEAVGDKEKRKIKARGTRSDGVWFGLGMFGIVGWSVAMPTVVGVFLGIWIDRRWPGQFSWTLMLLIGGLILGCLNAWHWVGRERTNIERADAEDPQKGPADE